MRFSLPTLSGPKGKRNQLTEPPFLFKEIFEKILEFSGLDNRKYFDKVSLPRELLLKNRLELLLETGKGKVSDLEPIG